MDFKRMLRVKRFLEIPFPRIKEGLKFRVLPALVIIPGMSHLMPKISFCLAWAGNCHIYAYPNPLNLAIFLNGFAKTAILPSFGINNINPLDKGWRYVQPPAFGIKARTKSILYNIINVLLSSHLGQLCFNRNSGASRCRIGLYLNHPG